jgi:transposase InsO family protein
MMPVNRVGGAFCAPSKILVENVFFVFHRIGTIHRLFASARGTTMSEPAIPSRFRLRVKQRLTVLTYVEEHGVKPAGRHFGLNHKTVRRWRIRHETHGVLGLVPRYPKRRQRRVAPEVIPLVKQARLEHRFGAARTRIWLQRVHGIGVATQTIQRLFRDFGLTRLPSRRKRRPKQLRLFAKDQPGDSVQVDVKFVRVNRQRYFQYTALDDCTRFRVLRLYRQLNHHTSLAFFRELRTAMPFPIQKLQSDNGTEFPLDFALTVQAAGIRHRYITPRRPEQNGKVERSHRIDDEEFWQRYSFTSFDDAAAALESWERRYNHERFSMALHGHTPGEVLAAKLSGRAKLQPASTGSRS